MSDAATNRSAGFDASEALPASANGDGLTLKEIKKRLDGYLKRNHVASGQFKTLAQKKQLLRLAAKRRKRGTWRERLAARARLILNHAAH
jgi:hypothetical protein